MSYTTDAQHRDVTAIYRVGETRYFPPLSPCVKKKACFLTLLQLWKLQKRERKVILNYGYVASGLSSCFDFNGPRFSLNPQISYRDCKL